MSYKTEKWINRYFTIAKEISTWSRDPSTKIGAVIVGDNGQIISQGFNGFPRGLADSPERYSNRPIKYKYVVHAEANAIYNASHNGANTNNTSIFISGLPVCHECAKAIIQSGITSVYMNTPSIDRWTESTNLAVDMLKEAGVFVHITDESNFKQNLKGPE